MYDVSGEIYPDISRRSGYGEGLDVGAVFVRLAGCSSYCWGWGGRPVGIVRGAASIDLEPAVGCGCERPDLDAEFEGEEGEGVECCHGDLVALWLLGL